MRKAYIMLVDRTIREELMAAAGKAVYDQRGHDYGLARDDTMASGVEHISVTLNENGDYPGFTVSVNDIRPFTAKENAERALRYLANRARQYHDEEDSFGCGDREINDWEAAIKAALEQS